MTTSPAFSGNSDLVKRITANLAEIRKRISSTGRDPDGIRIVAVTKMFDAHVVRAASLVGLRFVGENYLDELTLKREVTSDLALTWHYLGALQTNKIVKLCANADLLCGVSRLKEVEKIARAKEGMAIYVQVDFTGAAGRNGAEPGEVGAIVDRARDEGLDVRGLMTVAPNDREATRRAFAAASLLADDLGLVERSMGMSDDLEIACEQGTSEVRLGRALFGPRMAASALT